MVGGAVCLSLCIAYKRLVCLVFWQLPARRLRICRESLARRGALLQKKWKNIVFAFQRASAQDCGAKGPVTDIQPCKEWTNGAINRKHLRQTLKTETPFSGKAGFCSHASRTYRLRAPGRRAGSTEPQTKIIMFVLFFLAFVDSFGDGAFWDKVRQRWQM